MHLAAILFAALLLERMIVPFSTEDSKKHDPTIATSAFCAPKITTPTMDPFLAAETDSRLTTIKDAAWWSKETAVSLLQHCYNNGNANAFRPCWVWKLRADGA
jgi:hypothetical protein